MDDDRTLTSVDDPDTVTDNVERAGETLKDDAERAGETVKDDASRVGDKISDAVEDLIPGDSDRDGH